MSTDADAKVVQTQLTEQEYERLRRVADQEGLPLKEVLRLAAIEFSKRQEKHDPDDPFFAGDVPADDDDSSLTAAKTDDYLYE
ncbi:hypothetical protein [Halorhabdus amylolytica]|uniref:hypothetical protein n=1 Tax=Halorhabdus amylolytica TaxID=2559573 RepID=UPI0010A9BEFC|nr:hypothetical protein [Halorhabdus amylolytica]